MTLPSKKLLSEVLGVMAKVEKIENDFVHIEEAYLTGDEFCMEIDHEYYKINIYELAHKIKEWARTKGYTMESRISQSGRGACKVKTNRGLTEKYANTEPEAIYEAAEWLLAQQDKGM